MKLQQRRITLLSQFWTVVVFQEPLSQQRRPCWSCACPCFMHPADGNVVYRIPRKLWRHLSLTGDLVCVNEKEQCGSTKHLPPRLFSMKKPVISAQVQLKNSIAARFTLAIHWIHWEVRLGRGAQRCSNWFQGTMTGIRGQLRLAPLCLP